MAQMTIKDHLGPFYAFLVIIIAIPSLQSIVWRLYVISASFMRHKETLGKLFQLSANAATLATKATQATQDLDYTKYKQTSKQTNKQQARAHSIICRQMPQR